MNAYQNHGTRTASHLHHPSYGTLEFAWDAGDWVVVCFHSANPSKVPHIASLFHVFRDKKPMTVEKNMARSLWNAITVADKGSGNGWTTTPDGWRVSLKEHAVTS